MAFADNSHDVIGAMLAPALLMAATGSLLISANNRLARVVDRLRSLIALWQRAEGEHAAALQQQIARHRKRSRFVLRACLLLYSGLGAFVGTSLVLAVDALSGHRITAASTLLGIVGVLCLLVASVFMALEVRLAVRGFDAEITHEMQRHIEP